MLICWSGGCDSTLALFEALPAGNVRTISINHQQVPAQDELKRARKAILKRLRLRGCKIPAIEVEVSWSGDFHCDVTHGMQQPGIWLSEAHRFLRETEDLAMGWIRGDDVWHYRICVFELFRQLNCISHKTGNLVAPLEWEHKTEVIRRLRAAELLDLCFWCENPDSGKACGRCRPCITHEVAVATIEIEDARQPSCPILNRKPKRRKGAA